MNQSDTVESVASASGKVSALNPMGYPPTIEQWVWRRGLRV
jgi:hypothetical protein